jgi:hypothetical protein
VANSAAAALIAKSGVLDLEFGWEPTPATTLAAMVPCQGGQKVGVGKFAWRGTTSDALTSQNFEKKNMIY